MTPFRSEKNTNWEGAFRIPHAGALAGQDQAGLSLQRHRPAPRLAADLPRHGRRPGRRREAEEGLQAIGRTYKNHIDGFNLLPYLTGKEKESPRKLFFYFSDDGDMLGAALRQLEDRVHGAALPGHDAGLGRAVHAAAAAEALQPAHRPLRVRRHHLEHLLRLVPPPRLYHLCGAAVAAKFAETFKDFPPVQKPNTFTIDDAIKAMADTVGGGGH